MESQKKVSIGIRFDFDNPTTNVDDKELNKINYTDSSQEENDELRQGLLICTRIEKWYKKSVNLGEIELQKTRLRWRQFKAVLYPDRLELYHFTNRIIHTKRLAYTIYLNKGYPYRPVRLTLISPQDFIWSIEYIHYERKSCIAFHFLSSKLSEAQDWYMRIYQQLPNLVYYKKLIPPSIDIRFVQQHHEPPILIRLPLQLDISVEKLKSLLVQLMHKDLRIPIEQLRDIKLYWQPKHMDIPRLNIPWMNELKHIAIPPFIEQTHQLELYLQEAPKSKKKMRNYDGLLTQKIWSEKRKRFRDRPYYGLVFGHQLFFFDGPFYNKYKKELKRSLEETNTKKKAHWLYVTAGFLFQQRKIMINKNNRHETVFQSAPVLQYKSPTLSIPDPVKLLNSHYMVDLKHQVVRAKPSTMKGNHGRLFELELNTNTVLYYEAPNTQIMLQWITMINNSISLDRFILFDTIAYKRQAILLSGEMYMKEDYHGTFQRYRCILSKDEETEGLMLYKMNDKFQQYEKCHSISLCQERDYVYSGDECIQDKLMKESGKSRQYYANDQLVTEQDKTSDCVFVIWQMKKRHFIPRLREQLSLFKFGHRLGNRGKYWIFKARTKQERDEWVWSLHFEINKLK